MKRIIIAAAAAALTAVQVVAAEPFRDANLPPRQRATDLATRMTLDEKIALLSGYNDFFLHPCQRLGVPAFEMADGPLGIASWGLFGRATAYPSALSLAASWNRDLATTTGQAFADDWRARGIHLMLAPGVNIYRASKGARNFEYFGEDPWLTSEMAMAFTGAVADGGVLPVVKHFAGNDQEYDRYNVSTEVAEDALREIYTLPFERLVTEGGVKAIMSGYNLLNGQHCSENQYLDSLLHKVWGFEGMHMSDWGATHSTLAAARAGLDLEMGSNSYFIADSIKPLLEQGLLTEADIDRKVVNIYTPCFEVGFFDRPQKVDSLTLYSPLRNRRALDAAREGIILLKNSDATLPFAPSEVKRIAVVGPMANPSVISDRRFRNDGINYGGGGSSKVNPWYIRNMLDGIIAAYPDAEVYYAEGVSAGLKRNAFANSVFVSPDGSEGLQAEYYATEEASTPVASRVERRLNYEWWGMPQRVDGLTDRHRIVWRGQIVPEVTDTLILFADGQGACTIKVDGVAMLDRSENQSFFYDTIKIPAEEGRPIDVEVDYRRVNIAPGEMRLGYIAASDLDFSEAEKIARMADAVVCCVGFDGSIELEGRDRPFELPYGQDMLVERMLAANPATAVVVTGGGGVDMSRWADRAPAIVHALYPGMEGGTALGEIISGAVNPSAKLPFTIERRWADSPACGFYDETRSDKKVYYGEGLMTGYRGYDKDGTEPLFPFGHGLSYTTFDYSDLRAERCGDSIVVTFSVTNTGKRAGAEVSQVYVEPVDPDGVRPLRELKGFAKTSLAPGETRRIEVVIPAVALRRFDNSTRDWAPLPVAGISVGPSSRSLPLHQAL
jgi:beta-glucosidase